MPLYEVELTNGNKYHVDADGPPTEQDLMGYFRQNVGVYNRPGLIGEGGVPPSVMPAERQMSPPIIQGQDLVNGQYGDQSPAQRQDAAVAGFMSPPVPFHHFEAPADAGVLRKIATGYGNFQSGMAGAMVSPASLMSAGVASAGPLARAILAGLFGGSMVKEGGGQIGESSVTGDPEQMTQGILNTAAGGLAGMGAAGELMPEPPLRAEFAPNKPMNPITDWSRKLPRDRGDYIDADVTGQKQIGFPVLNDAFSKVDQRLLPERAGSDAASVAASEALPKQEGQSSTPSSKAAPSEDGKSAQGGDLYGGLFFLDPGFWSKNFGKRSLVAHDASQLYNLTRNKMNEASQAWKELDTPEFREFMKAGTTRTPQDVEEWAKKRGEEVTREKVKQGDEWWKGLTSAKEEGGQGEVGVSTYGMGGKISEERARYDALSHNFDTLRRTFAEDTRHWMDNQAWLPETEEDISKLRQEAQEHGMTSTTAADYAQMLYLRNKGVQHTQGPVATPHYSQVSPRDTKKYPVERVDVHLPAPDKTLNTSKDPTLWKQDNLHENLPNTLGWSMVQYVPGPKGEKVALVGEAQSRWGQSVREAKEQAKRERTPELAQKYLDARLGGAKDHPLLRDYNRLILKATIEQARKKGQTHVVIPDAETAMMTEGHDVAHAMQQGVERRVGKEVSQDPDQAKGMRHNYDIALPKIMEELTGSKGEVVELGEHKNVREKQTKLETGYETEEHARKRIETLKRKDPATPYETKQSRTTGDWDVYSTKPPIRENLIFESSPGVKKTTITGRMYKIPVEEKAPTLQMSRKVQGANVSRAMDLLGASMYDKEPVKTVTKELLQNSFDAVSGNTGAKEISLDTDRDSVKITDNGKGMTPEEVITKMLPAFESGKEGAESAGGYGLAKIALFTSGESFKVVTSTERNGQRLMTELSGDKESWLKFVNEGAELPENVNKAGDYDLQGLKMTVSDILEGDDFNPGTSVEVKFPKDTGLWEARNQFNDTAKNFPGDVKFKRNGIEVTKAPGAAAPVQKKVSLPSADVEIRYDTSATPESIRYIPVMNKGLIQFSQYFGEDVKLPPLTINVVPKVSVMETSYPFTNNRDALKGETSVAVMKELKSLAATYKATVLAKFKSRMDSTSQIQSTTKRFLDITGNLSPDAVKALTTNYQIKQLAMMLHAQHEAVFTYLNQRYGQHWKDAHFSGFAHGGGFEGVRFGVPERGTKGEIYYDLKHIMEPAMRDLQEGKYDSHEFGLAVGERLAGVMLHEVAHQISSSEGEGHAIAMTELAGRVASQLEHVIKRTKSILGDAQKAQEFYEWYNKQIEGAETDESTARDFIRQGQSERGSENGESAQASRASVPEKGGQGEGVDIEVQHTLKNAATVIKSLIHTGDFTKGMGDILSARGDQIFALAQENPVKALEEAKKFRQDVKEIAGQKEKEQKGIGKGINKAVEKNKEAGAVSLAPLKEGYEAVKTKVGQILTDASMKSAPRTMKADPYVGNLLVRYAASKDAAPALAEHLVNEVLGTRRNDEAFSKKVGAVLVEDTLRGIKKQFEEDARIGGEGTPVQIANFRAKAAEKAAAVSTIIGKPDSPFPNEAVYRAAISDPEVMAAIERHKTQIQSRAQGYHTKLGGKVAKGGEETEAFINLKAILGDEDTARMESFTSGKGDLSTPLKKGSMFSKERKGSGFNYEIDYRKLAERMITGNYAEVQKQNLYKALVDKNLAVEERPGVPAPKVNGQPTEKIQIERKGTPWGSTKITNLWVRSDIAPEVRQAMQTDSPLIKGAWGVLAEAINKTQVSMGVDALWHTANMVASVNGATRAKLGLNIFGAREAHSVAKIVQNIYRIAVKDPGVAKEVAQFSIVGAGRGDSTRPGWTKIPQIGSAAIRLVDKAGRLTMNQLFDQLVEAGFAKNTEQNRREFINQMGQYNSKLMTKTQQLLRESGLSPFIVAGKTFNKLGLKRVTGSPGVDVPTRIPSNIPGVEIDSYKAAAQVRAYGLVGLLTTLFVVPIVANYIINKKPFGRPGTQVGQIDTGKDRNGKHVVIDPAQWIMLRRGMRITGVNAVVNDLINGDLGKDTAKQAGGDILSGIIHPYMGPPVDSAFIYATGKDSSGFQKATYPSSAASRLEAAALNVNPVLESIYRGTEQRDVAGAVGKTFAGAVGVKTVSPNKQDEKEDAVKGMSLAERRAYEKEQQKNKPYYSLPVKAQKAQRAAEFEAQKTEELYQSISKENRKYIEDKKLEFRGYQSGFTQGGVKIKPTEEEAVKLQGFMVEEYNKRLNLIRKYGATQPMVDRQLSLARADAERRFKATIKP